MLFNSYVFWLFFAAVLALYWGLGRRRLAQNAVLLIASYIFYGVWDWRYLFLLWFSTAVDYFCGKLLGRPDFGPRTRRLFITVSVVTQLTILGFFKYYGFFVKEFVALAEQFDWSLTADVPQIILPIGISFYTFQTMSYTIDVYRRKTEPARNLFDFAVFASFFPQLVAGPIERFKQLMPQFLAERRFTAENFQLGVYHIMIGLFKKMVIADTMAPIADAIFKSDPSTLTGAECLAGMYAFAFQIYGDFSGYSSIAQGVARWLGFDLMDNFNRPYFAVSPSDFWRRWHISLSQWLRDYLYISLGGNRVSPLKVYRNLIITMVLGGLWHGAAWTYVLWGLYHGLLLAGFRMLGLERSEDEIARQPLWRRLPAIVLMFHLATFGWLLFRATSMTQVSNFLWLIGHEFRFTPFTWYVLGMIGVFALPWMLFEAWQERRRDLLALLKVHWAWRAAVYVYLLLTLWFLAPEAVHEFIYFQF